MRIFSASKKPLWLKGTGLISFFMFFMVQKTLFFYLYMSQSGVKKVQFYYSKKIFFQENLKNDVQEGLHLHTTSYLGSDELKMSKTRKIFF